MKTRIFILLITIVANYSVSAQRTITPTDTLKVIGKIKNSKTFSLSDLDAFAKTDIKNQIIYNQKGEAKDTLYKLKGVPIKMVLASIEFIYDKPKVLNELYFVFTASDGYKVVFSWNEIYNTETGNGFFIVTEIGGKKLKEIDKRILFLSTDDLKSGRRFIKGLKTIEVRQAE